MVEDIPRITYADIPASWVERCVSMVIKGYLVGRLVRVHLGANDVAFLTAEGNARTAVDLDRSIRMARKLALKHTHRGNER